MITVNLPHYNRPYILELNVLLLRHFLGDSIRIVVADDGSEPEIVKKIKQLPIDNIFANKTHNRVSFGKTMSKSIARCLTEYYMFCEDDFIYLKSPIPARDNICEPKAGNFFRPIEAGSDAEDAFSMAAQLLTDRPEVGMVKLQLHHRIMNRLKSRGVRREGVGEFGFFKCHVGSWTNIYLSLCNSWPYVVRNDMAQQLRLSAQIGVHDRQGIVKGMLANLLAKQQVMVFAPGRMLHIGNGISTNKTRHGTDKTRKLSSVHLQQSYGFSKLRYYNFATMLGKEYCKGNFRIDVDKVLEDGLNAAFCESFEALAKHGK